MNQQGVNRTGSSQRESCARRVRLPFLAIAALSLMVLGAATIFWSAVTVNRTKDLIVREAREEALMLADRACTEIEGILDAAGNVAFEELARRPDVLSELQGVAGEAGIVMVAISDLEGRVLYQQFCEEHAVSSGLAPQQASYNNSFVNGEPLAWDAVARSLPPGVMPLELPLNRDGVQIGRMQVALSSQLALARIDALSQQITSDLLVMVLLFFAVLLLTIALGWVLFLRQMELQRRASETEHLAQVGALAAGMAHEIRNPLHAMGLHLGVAREELEGRNDPAHEDSIESIGRVQRQIEHLNGIVGNFLSIALPARLELRTMRLDRSLQDALRFFEPEFRTAGIEMEEDLPGEMPLHGDDQALQRIFTTVLVNARQVLGKMPEGARRLRISARRENGFWLVRFEDSGSGVPPGEEEKIFRPFVSKRCGGTGFSLAIARRIAEGHGGTLSACPDGGLGGACFELRLPAVTEGGAASERRSESSAETIPARIS